MKRRVVTFIIAGVIYSVVTTVFNMIGISLGAIPTILIFLAVEGFVLLVSKKDTNEQEKPQTPKDNYISLQESPKISVDNIDADVNDVNVNDVVVSDVVSVNRQPKNKKGNVIVIVLLSVVTVISLSFGIFSFMSYYNGKSEIEDLQYEYDSLENRYELRGQFYTEVSEDYEEVSEDYNNLQSEYDGIKDEYDFYNQHAVCVNDGYKYYHKYSCEYFDSSEFYIYNVENAKYQGYKPCPHCFK